jgi:RNA polymerase sigma-70 factor (ECF subfamily)
LSSSGLFHRLSQPTDADSWGRFVELYTPLLSLWAGRTGLPEADAADLVAEVFARLARGLPQGDYGRHRSFRRWLRSVTLECWRERASGAEGSAAHDAAETFGEAEYHRHLGHRALKLLRPEFPPPVWLACWRTVVEGMRTSVVGAELGMTTGAVRAARFRVLARLRAELDGLLDGPAG